MMRSTTNGIVSGRLRNWIYRLLLGSLLCSIPLMSMPVFAQNSEQNLSSIESGGQPWEEEDPIPIWLESLVMSLAAEIAEWPAEEGDVEERKETLELLLTEAIGGAYTDLTVKLTKLDKNLSEDINLLEVEYAEKIKNVSADDVKQSKEIRDLEVKIEDLEKLKKIVSDLKNAIDTKTKLRKDAAIVQTQRIDDLERSIQDLTNKIEESESKERMEQAIEIESLELQIADLKQEAQGQEIQDKEIESLNLQRIDDLETSIQDLRNKIEESESKERMEQAKEIESPKLEMAPLKQQTQGQEIQNKEIESLREEIQNKEIESLREEIQNEEIESLREEIQNKEIESLREKIRDKEIENLKLQIAALSQGIQDKEIESLRREIQNVKELERPTDILTSLSGISGLAGIGRIQDSKTMVRKVPRRFEIVAGGWFPKSMESPIIIYEAQIRIVAGLRIFGGGGGNALQPPWMGYYGLGYNFFDFINIGVGGVNSPDSSRTELMYRAGISLGGDRMRLNLDYFYLPEQEANSGVRVGIAIRL